MLQVTRQPTLTDGLGSIATSNLSYSPMDDMDDKDIGAVFDRPLYQELINSDAFERLREIKFLGAIDYVITSGNSARTKRHTRFQHSLRVGQLAIQYSRLCDLNEADEILLATSGLLHDIGHAPLSHSLERMFEERFGLNHHSASEMIIRGSVPLGSQLPRIFKKYRIVHSDILQLIEGTSSAPYVHAFKCPINIDTVEAVTRSYSYISKKHTSLLATPVIAALVRKNESDVELMDEFWQLKDRVYQHLITSELGLLADYVCQQYMLKHPNLWKGTYFHSELEFRRRHNELFSLLRNIKLARPADLVGKGLTIPYRKRRFIIDNSVRIRRNEDLYRRYRQTREDALLELE